MSPYTSLKLRLSGPRTPRIHLADALPGTAPRPTPRLKVLGLLLSLTAIVFFPVSLRAQTFETTPALFFTMPFGSVNPLPQMLPVATTGTRFSFGAVASTTSGGSWLKLSGPLASGYTEATPYSVPVTISAAGLAAGTYQGQVALTSGSVTVNVPVTLTIKPSTAAFLDNLPGQLSFSMETSGSAPPPQAFQIRNAGAGTLNWTVTPTVSVGSGWLTASSASGTGTSNIEVTVTPSKLPGAGVVAGTYVGQLAVQTAGDEATIPVAVTVGASVFPQVNPLSFNMPSGAVNPLPQLLTVASTGTYLGFYAQTFNAAGGNWLQVPASFVEGYSQNTPYAIPISINAAGLAPGSYTGEVLVTTTNYSESMTVPVTLTVSPSTEAFFDSLPGLLSYSLDTGGNAPPSQQFQIRNAGAGTLSWTLSKSTSDGGNWLETSATTGAAPSTVTVTIVPANLPGAGQVPGTFTGQLVLLTAGSEVTIPISVTVGTTAFEQVNALNFTTPSGVINPLPQVITAASTGTRFSFYASAFTAAGGNWLQIPASFVEGYSQSTPYSFPVTINAAGLAPGTYTGEIVMTSTSGSPSTTVPVSLTVKASTAAFFDNLPGQLSFSMLTGGTAPPAQPLQIRNAGAGVLNWTGSTSTADGGAWLSITPASGTAPSIPTVTIIPANLPGGGSVAGTFNGQVVLQTSGDTVTIPVVATVGASVFEQVNGLNFTVQSGTANPLSQLLTVASTGTILGFYATAYNGAGGSWLQIPASFGEGYSQQTPYTIPIAINAAGLAAGTYTGEVIITATTGSPSMTVPVTLTVTSASSTFFGDITGGVSFSMTPGGAAPPAQAVKISHEGVGTLDWTLSQSTADGGKWLTVAAATGTAPSTISVSVLASKLPGAGQVAGVYQGQIVLGTTTDRTTIPVTVSVGPSVFGPPTGLSFTQPYGGALPAAQNITVASTGTNFGFYGASFSGAGGNWLQIPSLFAEGYSEQTPYAIPVNVASTGAAPGIYTGEVVLRSTAGGMSQVIPVTLTVTTTTPAANPVFTPPAGEYPPGPRIVTITESAPDAAIYYTTNGTVPNSSSAVYSGPITVTASETISAIAAAAGYPNSADISAAYIIDYPVPTETAISPTSAITGGSGFTLTVTGTNFVQNVSVVKWNGVSLATTFVSATELQAAVPATDLAVGGVVAVTVFTPTPGGGTSASQIFTVANPVPVATSLAPASMVVGSAAFTLVVNGSNFINGSVVKWNGSARTTTYVSATKLQAAITVADIASVGTASITVTNGTPGGGTSTPALSFSINYPLPTATLLSPVTAIAGGPAFTLTVTGTNFFKNASVVQWNGANRVTTFVSATQLTAAILATDLASVGTASVTVFNPTPGGGTSAKLSFAINYPAPTATSVLPTSAIAGGAAFTLTVNGTNFVKSTSVVRWNGSNRVTTFVSATQLTAAILSTDLATAGTASVAVFNPTPGGGTSAAQTFTIDNPVPTLASLSPTSAYAGGAAFALTVNGTNFVKTSAVKWNGTGLATTYVSATQLTAAIPATDIAIADIGTVSVTVFNPTPGGGTTAAKTFTINSPQPPPAPIFSPVAGTYGAGQVVTISDPGAGVTIYYTTNGTTPTTSSTPYTGPILVEASQTITALPAGPGYSPGTAVAAKYLLVGSPTVLSIPATAITSTGATLTAVANDLGVAGQVWFIYGTSKTALTSSTTPAALPAQNGAQTVTTPLTGLTAKTTYYVQPVVSSPGGTAYGAILSFTTE